MTDAAIVPTATQAPVLRVHYGASSLRAGRLDRHTRLTLWMIKTAIRRWKSNLPGMGKVLPPTLWGALPLKRLPFGDVGSQIELPTLDEDWPEKDRMRDVFLAVLRSRFLLPLRDTDDRWVNAEEARDAFQEMLPLGSYMARPYHYWSEMSSDKAMSRIAFAGLGALRLLRHQAAPEDPACIAAAEWVSDLSYLRAYDVRPGFEHYGAKLYFDDAQRPIAIYWCHGHQWLQPGDAGWEHAKWAWRCSLLVGTTLTDHLVGVHWLVGNYVSTAARTCLSPTHHLRLLLKPFTWRTVTINAGASATLCPPLGFVHRASALTYPALQKAFADSVKLMRFMTVPQLIARKRAEGMGDRFPWATDALALYEVIHAFVDEYITAYEDRGDIMKDPEVFRFWQALHTAPSTVMFPSHSREALVEVLSQFIWCVTGLHEAVGTVHENVLDPTFMGTKIRPGAEISDVQASVQCLLVMALTGLDMPKLLDLGDAAAIFGSDQRGALAFRRFHERLVALSAQMDVVNAGRAADPDRPWPCETFNPKNLEIGVSI